MNFRSLFFGTVLPCLAAATAASGANPIVSHLFTADPAAHIFGDRLYVYTSHDEPGAKYYDMFD